MLKTSKLKVGHSLSWKHENDSVVGPCNKLIAKIWTPSDPRQSNDIEEDIISDQR